MRDRIRTLLSKLRGQAPKYSVLAGLFVLMVVGYTPVQAVSLPTNSPAQNSFFGTHTKDFSRAAYGCELSISYGVIPVGIQSGTRLVSFMPSSTSSYTDISCIIANNSLTPAQKAVSLMEGQGGGLGAVAFGLNTKLLDQRPYSGVVFAADTVEKLVLPDQVYAQANQPYFPGTGFDLLTPMRSFWGWAVTLSYSFMVLIVIVVAVAMMFRARLDGKTYVQLQNAIPGIVMAMVLIPLSYPISGLFVDVITLSTNVTHDFLFSEAGPAGNVFRDGMTPYGSKYSDPNLRGLYADDPRVGVFNARDLVNVRSITTEFQRIFVCAVASQGDDSDLSNATSDTCSQTLAGLGLFSIVESVLGFFGQNLASIVGELAFFIVNIMMLVICFRIFKRLITQFATLLLLPAISPFLFATLAIPGQGNAQVIDFLKRMLAASLHFIVTYAMFLLATILTSSQFLNGIPEFGGTSNFVPPLFGGTFLSQGLGNNAAGGLVSSGLGVMILIVGVGIFFWIPSVLDRIRDRLAPKPKQLPFATEALGNFRDAYSVAFREAPGFASSRIARPILNNTVGAIGRRRGAVRDPNNPFGDSTADSYVDSKKKQLEKLDQEIANESSWVARQGLKAQRAAIAGSAGVRASIYGKSGAFDKPTGEKPPSVKLALKGFDPLRAAEGAISGSIKELSGYTSSTFSGELVITTDDDATAPTGSIFFASRGAPDVIAKLETTSSASSTSFGEILVKVDDSNGTYKGRSGVSEVLATDKRFAGKKEIKLKVKFTFPPELQRQLAPGSSFSVVWATGKDTGVQLAIGDSPETATLRPSLALRLDLRP